MKKIYLLTALMVSLTAVLNAQFTDDMENYDEGPVFNDIWTTWDGTNDGEQNAIVSTNYASSGTKSMYIGAGGANGGPQDAVLQFGEGLTSGSWSCSWMMYIPADSSAYFNLQGSVIPNANANLQFLSGNVNLNSDNASPGMGNDDNAEGMSSFSFPHGEWFQMVATVNFDSGIYSLTANGSETEAAPIGAGISVWGGVDFFAADQTNGYYIDDVELVSNPIFSVNELESTDYLVYPNPASDVVTLLVSDAVETICIYNLLGEELLSFKNRTENKLEVTNLETGYYLVKFKSSSDERTVKLLKR